MSEELQNNDHPDLDLRLPDAWFDEEVLSKLEKHDAAHLWIDNIQLNLPNASGKPGFDTICWLGGMPEAESAAFALKWLCNALYPLMEKRNISIFRLEEFFPIQGHNQGLNWASLVNGELVSRKIQICLRQNPRIDRFKSPAWLLVIMLHELKHLYVGPHTRAFYDEQSKLEAEFFDLHGICPNEEFKFYKQQTMPPYE